MPKSMTGFGRAKKLIGSLDITAEIKSVNHRFFEFSCRMPRAYQFAEDKLKSLCQKSISRGKIELSVFIEDTSENGIEITVNNQYVNAYLNAIKSISKDFGIKNNLKTADLIGNSEIFSVKKREIDEEEATKAILETVSIAIEAFIEMRKTEGEGLKADLISKLEGIIKHIEFIESRSAETVKAYRERLEQKVRELLDDVKIDEQRLLTETAVFADKVAIDEETVRLRSHISQFKKILDLDEPIGKKLDFIVQEMNRETNTIGSKSQNIEIAHTVVEIKSEIEKIREQIQNIE